MSDTAVIILNYKTWEDTLEEIEQIHQKLSVPYQNVIVVDNHSPGESSERLSSKALEKGYTFLEADENRGYAAGNNIGLKAAGEKGYSYALILNNDILFTDEDTLTKLRQIFRRDERVAVANPDIYSPDGYLYNRDAVRPSFFDLTLGMGRYREKGRQLQDLGGYGYIYRPQGCCMMVDLRKLCQVEYLDEHTFLYVEEPILAERLAKKGYVCACCTDTSVIHNHSRTVRTTLQKRQIRRIHNQSFAYYLREYREFNPGKRDICLMFQWLKLVIMK
ncbi:MAG: glycosyltransferase family 2 protein [Lachnospiraceae bacterium]|nr:glycosyltransferase family 2 protein [Lachnospiraceae bacterium]